DEQVPRVRECVNEEDTVILGINQVPGPNVSDAQQHRHCGDKDGEDLDGHAHRPPAEQPLWPWRHTGCYGEERGERGPESTGARVAYGIRLTGAEQGGPEYH